MKPILFLDFDGVLNNLRWFKHLSRDGDRSPADLLDPVNIGHLNDLVERSGCDVVISSSWRHGTSIMTLRALLVASGFRFPRRVIGKTPERDRAYGTRGDEISAWMSRAHATTGQVVILDDDDDMGEMCLRLVKTHWRYGLRGRHVREALRLWGISK